MKKDSKLLDNLNNEQIQAVTHTKGPLLIIAGAGTGKTTVITRRIAWLIEQKLARPEEILALTFTEKAAAEMEERVDVLVPYGYIDTWISTFHAFGDRILRDNYLELGISGTYEILTSSDQMAWLKNRLFDFPLHYFRPLANPTKHIEDLMSFISRCKDENILPDEYEKYADRLGKNAKTEEEKKSLDKTRDREAEKQFELSQFYKYYQNLLLTEGKFDFGDLIIKSIELFNTHPEILKKYQSQFKYILLDEFQDTNYAQNELVKLLAGNHGNITVVGDDDQSIYKFRGAAISNILDFTKSFPKAKLVVLNKNYRTVQPILDSAYKLIQNNNPDRLEIKHKINKRLISIELKGLSPEIIHTQTNTEEIKRIIEIIKEEHNKGISYSDIAILARANDHLESFVQELLKEKIPYVFSGGKGMYELPEIKLLISLIKAITNPLDSLAHFNILTSEFYNLESWEINKINSWIKNRNANFLPTLERIIEYGKSIGISDNSIKIIDSYISDLKKYSQMSLDRTGGQLIYQFLADKKYLFYLIKNDSIVNEIKIKNISKFFKKIKSLEKYNSDKSIQTLANNLDDLENYAKQSKDSNADSDFEAINLITIHGSKGLEFEIVFMVDLVNDRFPSRKQKEPIEVPQELIREKMPEGDFHLEEERRLFYVGMTRAKKQLYLCFADDYGGTRKKKPSIFVSEAIDNPKLDLQNIMPNLFKDIQAFELPFEDKNIKIKIESMFSNGKLIINPHKIDDYLTCPLKFKYLHILEIPVLKYHHVVYGRAIHEAIRFYYDNKIAGKKVNIDEIIKIFQNNWDSEGFLDRKHEEERFRHGIETLSGFYQKAERENILPTAIEKCFKFDFDGVTIKGRFDIIYDRKSDSVEISDFKTSEIDEQEKANERAKESNQLALYALAWQIIEGRLPDLVSLDFIDTGLKGTYEVKEKRIEKVKSDIIKVKEGIEKADFSACANFNNCHYCAYKSICPFKYKGA